MLIKAKLIIDQVMIAESILTLLIYQKEKVARIDAKANRLKLFLTFNVFFDKKNNPSNTILFKRLLRL